MPYSNFNLKAATYEQNALVQKSASEVLLKLISIQENEDVLDLCCGPGNVTRKIASLTDGKVVGVDISEGMVKEAIRSNSDLPNVNYFVKDVKNLGFTNRFDVIYCNSAFQWFLNPKKTLEQCLEALKPGGRMGIQSPATENYCPNFVAAVKKVHAEPATKKIFSSFQSPWFFLDSAEEYRQLFEDCGFHVIHCELKSESARYSVDQVYRIYQSGAENGYLNQNYYSIPLTNAYIETFRHLVKESIKEQADTTGMVELKFFRIYLIAQRLENANE